MNHAATASKIPARSTANVPVPATNPKPKKKERSPEEKEALMNEFLLGINGYHVGEVGEAELNKMNNYVVQGDGIYLVIQNSIGQFITKIADMKFPGLPKQFNGTRIKLNVPKIPSDIYHQIVQFFTDISEDMGEAEAFCQVYYDKTEKEYVVHVPEQTVSKASVNYDATKNLSVVDSERYVFVFEIHSHNTMNAFWSGTDNADEKDTRFYGVLGHLDKDTIAEKYRYMIMGQEVEIKKEHIFDLSEDLSVDKEELKLIIDNTENLTIDDIEQFIYQEKEVKYPETWIDNIKKPYQQYGGNYGRGAHGFPRSNHYQDPNTQKNPNYGTVGRPTRSSQMDMFGNDGWDQWDEYEDYQNSYGIPTTEDEREAFINAHLETIHEAYDMTELKNPEEEETALEAIACTIEPELVPTLIEKLIDYGHDGKIQEVTRRA
jgi:PRTRC genetic system protein A